ncbi:hypothetical protein AB0K89_08340 [Streptomyces cinnamoneus]
MRFDGWIAGLGTASGTRVVLGHWLRSPFGAFSDVMVELPGGVRMLFAPNRRTADFIAATYSFDQVVVVPVSVDPAAATWTVTAGPLTLWFAVGRRTALGRVLRLVPAPVATRPAWAVCVSPVARLMLGVPVSGGTGRGRREFYGVRDLHSVVAAGATWEGEDLGPLARVEPPVRFGFASVPAAPSLVRVVTTVVVTTVELR